MRTIVRCFICRGPVTVVQMMDRSRLYRACGNCGHTESGLTLGEAYRLA